MVTTTSTLVTASRESLTRLSALAREAGRAILEHYHAGTVAERKADHSPITAADRAAHDIIEPGLRGWDPAIPVVSEEGEIPAFEQRRYWSRFWLVDPLDGTKEFLHRNGEFTVNIALVDAGVPVLGVIYAPALDLLYYAGRGLGAWKEAARGEPERITSTPAASGAELTVVESRSHPSAELEEYLKTLPVGRRVQVGSSLKFCWVAEGKADIYPRLGPTMEWDVAAGDCIYRNSAQEGERWSSLRYNTATLRNARFIIGIDCDPAATGLGEDQ